MKTKKEINKNEKGNLNLSLVKDSLHKLEDWLEQLLYWCELDAHTWRALVMVGFGVAVLYPALMPWHVLAWALLSLGGLRLLLILKNRWL